jgi:CubicO group peptidase (beta-lactamase class C family)
LGWNETGFRTAASELLVPLISEQGQYTRIRATTDGSQGNLFVSARELAYWGYLHMTSGKINGKAVVPEAVIRTAVMLQSPTQLPKGLPWNGCLWFIKNGESSQCTMGKDVPDNSFEVVGSYGPLVLVVPELELVVVRMSNQEKGNYADDRRSHLDYLKEFSNLAVTCARRAV